jgi:hypothetical protein
MKLTREQVIEQYNKGRRNFRGEDLSGLDLSNLDFRGADLSDANFHGADLCNCTGNMKEIKSMRLGKYNIVYTKDILAIGYDQHTIEEWKNFTDDKINKIDVGALKCWVNSFLKR